MASQTESVDYYSKSWNISEGVNMTNCTKQRELFFRRYNSINLKVLIGFWMKAGYLGPVNSAERTYSKGHALLMELINEQRMLQFSDESKEMIELATGSWLSSCRHQGFCVTEDLGHVGSVNLDKIGLVEVKDGMPKEKKLANRDSNSFDVNKGSYGSKSKELKYTAYSNPRPDSLKPLLDSINKPSELLLRGCDLALQADFPLEKFSTLSVLEISGLSQMPFSLQEAISQLYQLQTLNLSYLPFRKLGIDFSPCRKLRQLIFKGFSYLESVSFETISHLASLQCLHLSDLLIKKLPSDFFSKLLQLRWVILRSCSKLSFLPSIRALKHLKMLDVSHCSALQIISSAVLLNPELQILDFSYTSITNIPTLKETPNLTHLIAKDVKVAVLSCLRQVRSLEVLDLSGAKYVTDIKQLVGNKKLTVLDLSRTEIESIYFLPNLIHLRELILRQCAMLGELPAVGNLTKLRVLDLSGCRSLSDLPKGLSELNNLEELDFSLTRVGCLPSFTNLTSLLKLSLRGLKLDSIESLASLSTLEQLDLNGLQITSPQEMKFEFLQFLVNLCILDLSHTLVAKLPDMSMLVNLKVLLLMNCRNLQLLPDLQSMTSLETLDLSLPTDYTGSNIHEETQYEAQTVQFLSAPTNLRKFVLTNRPGVLTLFPFTSLARLEYLDICGTGEIDFVREHSSKMENLLQVVGWNSDTRGESARGRSSKADEFHVVSTFYQSGFERFKTNFTEIQNLIEEIQMKGLATASIRSEYFKRHFQSMLGDLQYLLQNISLFENSHDPKISEELLHELVNAATDPSSYDFLLDSTNIDILLRLVLKLKLLVPTKQVGALEASEITRGRILKFTRRKNKERDVTDDDAEELRTTEDLHNSYRSLNDVERECLLCFSVFSPSEGRHGIEGVLKRNSSLVIKKRMLVQWWVGEGFIDPQNHPGISNSDQDVGAARDDANQVSQQVSAVESRTTAELGRQIFKALEEKQFIDTVMHRGRDSGTCCMSPFVLSFVTKVAETKMFCNLGQRIRLIKSQDSFSSFCKPVANKSTSSKRLDSLNTTRALLNVNEPIIDIRAEWFSKMINLLVLHLGSWCSQDNYCIEVVDHKFLEELNRMKQLRLLSFQGFSAMTKLPDSVCKLANLRILNLRDCSYLEELPADIGSLKNLIHLDVAQCSFLSMLPKGVRLLSKLEVLKGLVIAFQPCGNQHEKAFSPRDLLDLENLTRLSINVNNKLFPGSEDVQIIKDMKKLCNLKITWQKSYILFDESNTSTVTEPSRHSRWQWIKCFGSQETQNDTEKTLKSNHLDNLKKLVLCCFPSEVAPEWLDPSELKNLEKLYIVGGSLETLRGTDQNTWNVNTLSFKYLRKLKILWPVLRDIFPKIAYLENHQCDKLSNFPGDDEGVWTIEAENKNGEGNATSDLE